MIAYQWADSSHRITVFIVGSDIVRERWDKMALNKYVEKRVFGQRGEEGHWNNRKQWSIQLYQITYIVTCFFSKLYSSSFSLIQEKTYDLFSERSCRISITKLHLPVEWWSFSHIVSIFFFEFIFIIKKYK